MTDAGQSKGTQLDGQTVDSVRWVYLERENLYRVRVSPGSAFAALRAALVDRLRIAGTYAIGDRERLVRFEVGSNAGVKVLSRPPTLVATYAHPDQVDPYKTLARSDGSRVVLRPLEIIFEDDDERIDRLLTELSGSTEIRDGTVRIAAVGGRIGGELMIAVTSLDADIDPIAAVEGIKGFQLMSLTEKLGGQIHVLAWSPNVLHTVLEALSPCSAKTFEQEDGRIILVEPVVRAQTGTISDERAIELAEQRRALVSDLVKRPIELRSPWRIVRT